MHIRIYFKKHLFPSRLLKENAFERATNPVRMVNNDIRCFDDILTTNTTGDLDVAITKCCRQPTTKLPTTILFQIASAVKNRDNNDKTAATVIINHQLSFT